MFTKSQIRPESAYVLAHSSPADKIFVWGFAPEFYVESQRMPASRYSVCDFLTGLVPWTNIDLSLNTDYAIVPGAWGHFIREMAENKPKFIIDTSPANISYYGKCPMSRYPALEKIIREHYIVDPQFVGNQRKGSVIIYVRVAK